MSCLILTPEIKKLAKEFPNETEQSILNLVGIWQEKNNKSLEDIPLKKEFENFIKSIRNSDKQDIDDVSNNTFSTPEITTFEEQKKVDLDFDPQMRRDRVTLISKFFSNEVDKAIKEIEDNLRKRITASESEDERVQLQSELNTLNRLDVIKKVTPRELFSRVYNIFKGYTDSTSEERVQAELDKINSSSIASKYSDEQKLEVAKKKAAYKEQAYKKIIDNFKALAEEAGSILDEQIRINPSSITFNPVIEDSSVNEDTGENEQADDYHKEETVKDGWMTGFREVSTYSSLSNDVRNIIRKIPKLDYRGKYEKDDLGFPRYLNADYVHATLIDGLRNMINSDDMIPILQELSKTKPWIKQVIIALQNDDSIFSQFYQDFRKDFTPYWIQKKKLKADGSYSMQTVSINKPEGIYYLLDEWRDNYESGNKLDEDSIYNEDGSINEENASKGLKWTNSLINMFTNKTTDERLNLLNEDRVWKSLVKLLNMIGINANQSVLNDSLSNIKKAEGVTFTDPIMILLPQLNIIFKGISEGGMKSSSEEKVKDLINTYGSAYNTIAGMLAEVTDDAIESSVRENGKSYYSHTTPNYLGKLIKNLKNTLGNKERFEKFINTEFRQYDWFYKDGRWLNDWIKQISESEEIRKGLNHKVVLNSDKVNYSDWSDLDYTLALLTEYWGEPDNKSNIKWAWYHVPILSDSPSAEFIRFRKYVSGIEYDENGNALTYDDIILNKMVDLVTQEYNRIMLVRQRDAEYQKGNPNIMPIANFDIKRKNGQITNIGGAEFKFIPVLNNLRFENGKTFIDKISELQFMSGFQLRDFIKDTLRNIMEEGFENTYEEWFKIGLFEETENGRYKYLPYIGQSQQNARIAKALSRARNIMGSSWTKSMDNLLAKYNSNSYIKDKETLEIFDQINNSLIQSVNGGIITKNEYNSIISNLNIKNNAKAALREYYWNSKFATSQIIELTTTDLAFYKNLEDFQKRYKEVHAPALRLNTKAMYNGERVGRDYERTIYLKDDEIVSSGINEIKEVLDSKVEKGELSVLDRDYILSKFKNVNVADAQAYRSLSSYRAVLGMSGQWTDDMERAYNNFKNGTWDMRDFSIIWQTKKPYVYTQVNNTSGVEGTSGIKTPVQHKNSEFLLMAANEIVANALGKSSKLRAINKFMEENGIDVVQFESTTKVGGQGIIDLNDVNTEEEVLNRLNEATGIGAGNENSNVVHKIDYEDYGFQTATPEHLIDATQLVGTQIRKLITADIANDAVIEVDGKKMTKKEWLDLYNRIITENIIESFRKVSKTFNDLKNVERAILEEVQGNKRYSLDMMKAFTLDENGNFNIPLYDPAQSQMVQQLINSIIKDRITKQKIKGGALIQVSDYGLTDKLHIVYEGEGNNKRIKYLECYMPAYSKDFFKSLMKEGTHELDITKLPEDLRKAIGYRIPTEDKYSMAPLMIKGFLPQQNGSAIMLPAEITTLSGSDFDKLMSK